MKATNLFADYCQSCATILTLYQRNETDDLGSLCPECTLRFIESGDSIVAAELRSPVVSAERPARECAQSTCAVVEKKKTSVRKPKQKVELKPKKKTSFFGKAKKKR